MEEFTYLVVKYGLGQSYILLTPALTLLCKGDIRRGMRTTFSSAVLCPVQGVQGDGKGVQGV